jgi:4-hydroxybenzoate polyprenyltransferase
MNIDEEEGLDYSAPSRWIKALDYVFLCRPTLMYPIWIFFLAGLWSGKQQAVKVENSAPMDTLLTGIGLTLVMAAVYILNQIKDTETDRINRKLFLICDGHVPVHSAYVEAFILGPSGIILGFLADIRAGWLLAFLLMLAGYIYSYPPSRMKDRPVGGLLVNGLGGMIIFTLGWIASGGEGVMLPRSLAYFGGYGAVMLNTTLPDIKGDETTGKVTFSVRYGIKNTVIWALVIELMAVSLAYYFHEWILFFPGLVMVPFFIYALTKKHIADVVRATKYSVFSMAVAICIIFPWFLLPVFLIFFGSRIYYKKRFGFDYPNLKG